MPNPYQSLDLDRNAPPEAIRAAYRKKAREHHPDKGGEVAKFQEIQMAYDVLSDAGRRAQYDKTGETGQGPSLESQALSYLSAMLTQFLDVMNLDVIHESLVEHLRLAIKRDIQNQEAEKAKLQKTIDRRKEAIKRLPEGPVAALLAGDISQREQALGQMTAANTMRQEAMRLMEGQTYRVDERVLQPTQFVQFFTTTLYEAGMPDSSPFC